MTRPRIPERDWKILRSMKEGLLNIACSRILIRIKKLIEGDVSTAHEKYIELFNIMRDEDKELGSCFDDVKRSNAIWKLAAWKKARLISDDQLYSFSEETQEKIRNIEQIWR